MGRVSGKPLAEFTRESIFIPLGMTSTQWRDDLRRIAPNRAIAYSQGASGIHQDMPFENAHGNGGLLTTVGDLLRWNRNFTEMKVGGPAFVAAEQQLGHLNDDRAIGYAAGLFLLHHHGLPDVSHSGATAGYRGWLARYPGQGLAVAMLCNNGSADPGQLGHAVADVYLASVLSNDATMPSGTHVPAASAPVGKETLDSFAGLYRSVRDRTVISIEVRAGHLEIDGRALRFVSDNLFREGATGPLVRFDTDTGEMPAASSSSAKPIPTTITRGWSAPRRLAPISRP